MIERGRRWHREDSGATPGGAFIKVIKSFHKHPFIGESGELALNKHSDWMLDRMASLVERYSLYISNT